MPALSDERPADDVQMAHLAHDHRYMPQIVSSAMWNCPPPSKLITLLERTNRASKVTHHTQEKMVRAFQVRIASPLGSSVGPCVIHAVVTLTGLQHHSGPSHVSQSNQARFLHILARS